MSSECIFEFDHPNKIYFSGETINGCVKLNTTKTKQVKSAYLLFEGRAKVRWYVEKPGTSETHFRKISETQYGDEVFIKERINIFTEGRLPPGLHKYTFNIPLPLKCRTSCTEKYGEIIYVISLIIERELTYNNIFSQPLTVIKPLDLNSNPDYLLPIQGEDVKYVCCFPCSSGPILSTLTISYGGWAPGQDISYIVDINNQSRFFNVSRIKVELKQIYKFTVDDPAHDNRTHENSLSNIPAEDRVVLHGSKREFKGKIRIPPVPPTLDSGIINISYSMGLTLHYADWNIDSVLWVPITIGTIPLIQTVVNDSVANEGNTTDLPPSYDLCTPATFEEPTHIGEKFKDIDRDEFNNFINWLPKYPVYNKLTDDLNSQIGWSPNMTVEHTNLFTSEITATAPEMDAPSSENIQLLKNESLLQTDYSRNFAPTGLQCPPYDENCYETELTNDGNDSYIEINMLPDDEQRNKVTELSDNNESNDITNLPESNHSNEVTDIAQNDDGAHAQNHQE